MIVLVALDFLSFAAYSLVVDYGFLLDDLDKLTF
jgi:hypothetical protein